MHKADEVLARLLLAKKFKQYAFKINLFFRPGEPKEKHPYTADGDKEQAFEIPDG